MLWPAWVNRVHALALPRWIIHALTILAGVAGGAIPMLIAADYFIVGWTGWPPTFNRSVILAYFAICAGLAVASIIEKVSYARQQDPKEALLANLTTSLDVALAVGHRPVARGIPRLLSRIPGNEVLQLAIQEKHLKLPRLPSELDGFRIAHLSDLHISGRIEQPYFDEVVAQTNRRKPDMVAITGDLFDRDRCMAWGVASLAALQAPAGVYYVLGNHDLLVNYQRVKELLLLAGLRYLGGISRQVDYQGQSIILSGNELPWFVPAAEVTVLPSGDDPGRPVRILLSHAPDQIDWAATADYDLMLCGHTHGGQICFPIVGAVASPSRYGTRFVGGVYRVGSTLMHVSRGTACLTPIRWNCPPEITILTLHATAHGCLRHE